MHQILRLYSTFLSFIALASAKLFKLPLVGTSGRTRTGTLLKATDFESVVSTNSTTEALSNYLSQRTICCQLQINNYVII